MKNPIKGALHIAKIRRLGKGPKIADLKGIESSPLMKQRRSVPYMERQPFADGGQPTNNLNATQQQPQNQPQNQQQVQQQPAQPYTPAQMAPATDIPSLISNLYNQYLGRGPTQEETNYWQSQPSPENIYKGISTSGAAQGFYTGQYNQANPQQYISSLYQNYMNRAPNQDEINYWQDQLSKGVSPNQVYQTIANDIGSQANMYSQMVNAPFASNTEWLNNVYQENMGRDANPEEQNYWQNQFEKGVTPDQVEHAIATDRGVVNQKNIQFIQDQYQALMGRDPNQDEKNYWANQMERGVSPGQVTNIISNDPGSQAYQESNFGQYQVAGDVSRGPVENAGLQNNFGGRLGAVVGNLGNQANDFLSRVSDTIWNYLPGLAGVESTGNPTAGAGSSSAKGLFQFVDKTWLEQFKELFGDNTGLTNKQILNLRTEDSPAGQAINMAMAAKYAQKAENELQQNNIPVTPENLYLTHFLGNIGLAKLAEQNPNARASDAMNRSAERANRTYARMKAKDLRNLINTKLNDPKRLQPTRAVLEKYQKPRKFDFQLQFNPNPAPVPLETTPNPGAPGGGSSGSGGGGGASPGVGVPGPGAGLGSGFSGAGSADAGAGVGVGVGANAGAEGSIGGVNQGNIALGPMVVNGQQVVAADPGYSDTGVTPTDTGNFGVSTAPSDIQYAQFEPISQTFYDPYYIDYGRFPWLLGLKRGGSVTHDNIRKRGMDITRKYATEEKLLDKKRVVELRNKVPHVKRGKYALGGQPTQNVDATQQQPQNQQQQIQQQPQQQQQVAPQTPMAPPTDRASLISNLYNQYLGRGPNEQEVSYWQGQASPEAIYQGISGSQAAKDYYTGQYNQANPQQYISSLYQNYMGRAPNQDEINYWQGQLNQGVNPSQLLNTISGDIGSRANMYSQMAAAPFASNTQWLNNVYQANMGRNANADEQQYWQGQFDKGVSPDQVADTIANDPGVVVPQLYQTYMGRDPNQDELNYWRGQMNRGATLNQVENTIANDPGVVIPGLYQTYLGRNPNQDEFDYWKGEMGKGSSADQIQASIANDPGVTVRNAYQNYLGREPTAEETSAGMNLLGPNRDTVSFISKTFPGQDPYEGVQVASNDISKLGPALWNKLQSVPSQAKENVKQLLDFISGGEGGYNSVNKGSNKPYTHNAADWLGQDLTNLTVGQVMGLQRAGKIFATGRYQIIPKTLRELVSKFNIDPNTPYNQETQDNLGTLLALRRPKLGAYITGASNDVLGAARDASQEWASLPNPNTGRSYYGSGNKAQHTTQSTINALRAVHKAIPSENFGISLMPQAGPSTTIPQAQTPSATPGPNTTSDAASTQNFLNQYLYDNTNFQPGTNVINPGGGSSGTGSTGSSNLDFQPGTNVINPGGGSTGSGNLQGDGSQMVPIYKTITTPGTTSTLTSGGQTYSYNVPGSTQQVVDSYQPAWQAAGFQSQGDYADAASSGYANAGSYYADNSGDFFAPALVPAAYDGQQDPGVLGSNYNPGGATWDQGSGTWYNAPGGWGNDVVASWMGDSGPLAFKRGGSVTHDNIRKRGMDALQAYASGGKVWEKKRPKSLGKPEKLDKDQKRSAKAAAKAAGRPYPNLIDNMRAAQKSDGGEINSALHLARRKLTKES